MICNKCGKNLSEGSKFCPFCGAELQNDRIERQMNGVARAPSRKPIPKFILFMLFPIIVIVILAITPEEERDKSETIEKLLRFTDMGSREDTYTFTYRDTIVGDSLKDWRLIYVPENEFVRVTEDTIISCFTAQFGRDCLKRPGFSYDLDENEIRIYFNVEIEEGDLSIINYSIDEDEFTLMIDGEKYGASDELIRFMNSYDIPQTLVDDIERFKEGLADKGISFDEISDLKYQDIVEYIENISQTASYEEEKPEAAGVDTSSFSEFVEDTQTDEETVAIEGRQYIKVPVSNILRYPEQYMGQLVCVEGMALIVEDLVSIWNDELTGTIGVEYENLDGPKPLNGDQLIVYGEVIEGDWGDDVAIQTHFITIGEQ